MEVAEPRARQPPALPTDLLLEIIARSDDLTTVVRCAAGCKTLRRAMLGPGFLDLLRRRAEANGGFDPALLMAVSYRLTAAASSTGTDSIIVQPPGRLRHFDTDLFPESSESASSRDGLLVVQRHGTLIVCNTITGHVTSLPSMDLRGRDLYQPALLSIDGAGRSFKLLVMYKQYHGLFDPREIHNLRAQIFSSQEDKWGATSEIHNHSLPKGLTEASSSAPAVVGRSVHWLCFCYTQLNSCELIILALHAESAHASVIRLPQELLIRMGIIRHPETRILATTATTEGKKRLSLVVAEPLMISTWTLAEDGSSISWSRQVVIRRREIGTLLTRVLDAYQPIQLCMFGERSGTVLF